MDYLEFLKSFEPLLKNKYIEVSYIWKTHCSKTLVDFFNEDEEYSEGLSGNYEDVSDESGYAFTQYESCFATNVRSISYDQNDYCVYVTLENEDTQETYCSSCDIQDTCSYLNNLD